MCCVFIYYVHWKNWMRFQIFNQCVVILLNVFVEKTINSFSKYQWMCCGFINCVSIKVSMKVLWFHWMCLVKKQWMCFQNTSKGYLTSLNVFGVKQWICFENINERVKQILINMLSEYQCMCLHGLMNVATKIENNLTNNLPTNNVDFCNNYIPTIVQKDT